MKRLNSIDILLNKYTDTSEILENFDDIAYFLRDDVERMLWKERKNLSWIAFSYSVNVTRTQLREKQDLSGIKKFLALDIKSALRWLVSRLKNNSMNYFSPKTKKYEIGEDLFYDESINYDLLDIEKIQLTNPEAFELGFKRLAKEALTNDDFDWQDFLYLCTKFEVDPNKYMLSPSPSSAERSNSGLPQLIFAYTEERSNPEEPSKKLRRIQKRKCKLKQGRLFL